MNRISPVPLHLQNEPTIFPAISPAISISPIPSMTRRLSLTEDETDRYYQSQMKSDMFNILLYIPYILHNSNISQKQKNSIFITVYINFIIIVLLTLIMLGFMLYYLILDYMTKEKRVFDLNYNIIIIITTNIITLIYIINQFYNSFTPTMFWWRNVKFSPEWGFNYEDKGNNTIKIIYLTSPKYNTIFRFCIVCFSQILIKVCLVITSILVLSINRDNYIDTIKDSLILVFVLNNDETAFEYYITLNSLFRSIWKPYLILSNKEKNYSDKIFYFKQFRSTLLCPLIIVIIILIIFKVVSYFAIK